MTVVAMNLSGLLLRPAPSTEHGRAEWFRAGRKLRPSREPLTFSKSCVSNEPVHESRSLQIDQNPEVQVGLHIPTFRARRRIFSETSLFEAQAAFWEAQ